ncbi:MAG TPA: hypothetical protein VNF29_02275 [Candidatus Binataceae bacterium]|nr:hypothetical protein [Candidatus Binataceae bacterium]
MNTVSEQTTEVRLRSAPNSAAIGLKNAPKLYATPYTVNIAANAIITIRHARGESNSASIRTASISAAISGSAVVSAVTAGSAVLMTASRAKRRVARPWMQARTRRCPGLELLWFAAPEPRRYVSGDRRWPRESGQNLAPVADRSQCARCVQENSARGNPRVEKKSCHEYGHRIL